MKKITLYEWENEKLKALNSSGCPISKSLETLRELLIKKDNINIAISLRIEDVKQLINIFEFFCIFSKKKNKQNENSKSRIIKMKVRVKQVLKAFIFISVIM